MRRRLTCLMSLGVTKVPSRQKPSLSSSFLPMPYVGLTLQTRGTVTSDQDRPIRRGYPRVHFGFRIVSGRRRSRSNAAGFRSPLLASRPVL